ncbi:MAG: carboxy terminal-processing peptidase [Methylophilaceae bacterium]|nr:carboxy terminal-processing peptidase [Methylophilaceae bacterium]
MKIIQLLVLLTFAATAHGATSETPSSLTKLKPTLEQGQAASLSAEVLKRYHYKPIPLNDDLSQKIFDAYIKSLDGEKIFFIQTDIDQFSNARTKLDDAILSENLGIPFAIFNLYKQRISERITYAQSLLKQGFDFTKQESYQYDREKAPWLKSEDEAHELWQKRVKNDWLRLKLAGKTDKNIVEVLNKRYDNYLKGINKLKSEDAFQSFMNAFAMTVDPHTNYFGIRASEDFDISMKLSLDGIGAVLEEKDEYTTIRELVAGGPAALSGKLKVGDKIVGVGQGEGSPIVDVTGFRLDDTVALIRGTTDSLAVLEILPAEAGPDGKHKFVSIIRKKISLEKQAAKKSIIEVKDGAITRHIGVITLPVFYEDFAARAKGDKDYKSATRDISALLDGLKKDKVDSVLIDLRNNGGGSLTEAINLTGLFIDQGPVVQERDAKGEIKVDSDNDRGVAWNGQMGVLINHASASASEIFAAAIQDYGRGIIIGETSFGKGTVQTVVDLDDLVKNSKPKFGELKMTVAQFFRINGGTTQLRGVIPDVSLPSFLDSDSFGEASYDNALPWSQIKAADYMTTANLVSIVPTLKANHDSRVAKDKDFQYLVKDIADVTTERKKNSISLNFVDRQKERDAKEAILKSREDSNASKKAASNRDDGLQSNERNLKDDLALEKANKDTKDILLNEAANIMSDEVGLTKTDVTSKK